MKTGEMEMFFEWVSCFGPVVIVGGNGEGRPLSFSWIESTSASAS